MSRFITLLAAAAMAVAIGACDDDETPPAGPAGCADDADCDDQVPCTLDTCDRLTGTCLHPAKACDDGDACTSNRCDAATGECRNPALSCDDLDGCTTDSCDPTAGCVHAPIACEGDGDPCTIAACVPATGACENRRKDCNDNNSCTIDACAATGDCTHVPIADGSGCSLGADFTDGAVCQGGECVPASSIQPGAFRVDAITFVLPIVTFDLGNGPEVVNDAISAYLTSKLGEFDNGGLVALFAALQFGGPGAALTVGEGLCTFQEGEVRWCGLLAGGQQGTFQGVQQLSVGTCSADPVVDAPCFKTPQTSFDLHEILPNFFPDPVDPVTGQAAGGLPGNPVRGIENGWATAFVPKTIVDGLSVDLGGRQVTGTELLSGVEVETKGGVEGYTVRLSFTAPRTAVQPAN